MKKLFVAAIAAVVFSASAHAADLVIEDRVIKPVAVDTSVYVQLLGGVEIGTDYTFNNGSDDFLDLIDLGPAGAATIGVVVMDGLSVELDGLYTYRVWTEDEDANISSLSLMGNLKYTAALNDTFSIYGAAGVGYIYYSSLCCMLSDAEAYGGFGYQLIGGVGAAVAENITVIGEVRYQDTFAPAEYLDGDDPFTIDVPTVSVLAGIKLGF